MNHKWEKTSIKTDKCKVCGCEREKHFAGKYSFYIYTRSSIITVNRFDCIDWGVENNKTID